MPHPQKHWLSGIVCCLSAATVFYGVVALAAIQTTLPPKSIYWPYSKNFLEGAEWPANISFLSPNGFGFCIIGDKSEISLPRSSKWNSSITLSIIDANGKGDRFISENCNAIFIATSEERRFPAILAALDGKPIMTISPIRKFAARGGMFELIQVGDNIRFIINRNAIESAGLRITNPQILELAISDPED